MKIVFLLFFISCLLASSAYAGNGVERGSVMIKASNQSPINSEILKFLEKKLIRCSSNLNQDYFEVSEVTLRKEKIDQGIIDLFYKIKLKHLSSDDMSLNTVTIEVLDSDFHNWRDYEEKLSLEIINDQNNQCL